MIEFNCSKMEVRRKQPLRQEKDRSFLTRAMKPCSFLIMFIFALLIISVPLVDMPLDVLQVKRNPCSVSCPFRFICPWRTSGSLFFLVEQIQALTKYQLDGKTCWKSSFANQSSKSLHSSPQSHRCDWSVITPNRGVSFCLGMAKVGFFR